MILDLKTIQNQIRNRNYESKIPIGQSAKIKECISDFQRLRDK